jgi:hypothetical protein
MFTPASSRDSPPAIGRRAEDEPFSGRIRLTPLPRFWFVDS